MSLLGLLLAVHIRSGFEELTAVLDISHLGSDLLHFVLTYFLFRRVDAPLRSVGSEAVMLQAHLV